MTTKRFVPELLLDGLLVLGVIALVHAGSRADPPSPRRDHDPSRCAICRAPASLVPSRLTPALGFESPEDAPGS
jgi:hypothetical protein